jgi:putative ABC transport system substrate-binding protein
VAQALALALQYLTVKAPGDFHEAFGAITRERADALITFPDALTLAHRKEIADFSARRRIPSISGWSEFAEAGGLITYGPNLFDSFKRVAVYVDKILKGTKPQDLPVEQPTTLELVVNLKTAKQIGLTISPNVLAKADKVIK